MADRKTDKEKLTLLDSLLDAGSFAETLAHASGSEVTTGYGTVNERLVFVYFQHGAVTAGHARKIRRLYDDALKMGAPVIGFLQSSGMKLDDKKDKNETLDIFDAYGTIFAKQTQANGVIPQISVVLGDCMGIASLIVSLSDFVFAHSKSRIFFSSPNTYTDSARSLITPSDEYASADYCVKAGLVHVVKGEKLAESVRELIGYLPSNSLEIALAKCGDDLNRTDESLIGLTAAGSYDMKTIIRSIADDGKLLELKERYNKDTVTGFIRLNGYTVGAIALKGKLNLNGMDKAREFVMFCDRFNIPILTLSDVWGFEGAVADDLKIMKSAADLYGTFVKAVVPKVGVIVNKAYGTSYFISNSRHCGSDIVFAWKGSKVSFITPEASAAVLKMKLDDSPENAAALGYIDDIIPPAETRKRVIASLEMLSSKRVSGQGGGAWEV